MKAFVENAAIGDMEGPLFREDSYRIFRLMDKTVAADSVNVSHILLGTQGASKEAMEAMADSLLGVLKAGGNFEALAAQYSMDQSGQQGGSIGWLTELDALRYFGLEFKNAIFASPINQPVILSSTYGVHILKITEKTPNVPKYKLAYVHLSVTPSTKTYTKLYNDLNQFISMNNSIEKMEAAAAEAGYVLNSNIKVVQEDRYIGSIPDSRPVVRWVFESKKKGEISRIFEGKNHFIVAARRGALPEGYQSVQSLSPMLRMELASGLKGGEIAKELKAKNLRTVYDYAEAMKAQVDTVKYINFVTPRIAGIGMEPKLNALITFAPLDQVSEPVVGANGVYVFSVINRNRESGSYDEQSEIRKLESDISYRAGYAAFQSLMEKAKIEDNRIRFE
jgi:peptidyl-prolyl cis-trans isomerase D